MITHVFVMVVVLIVIQTAIPTSTDCQIFKTDAVGDMMKIDCYCEICTETMSVELIKVEPDGTVYTLFVWQCHDVTEPFQKFVMRNYTVQCRSVAAKETESDNPVVPIWFWYLVGVVVIVLVIAILITCMACGRCGMLTRWLYYCRQKITLGPRTLPPVQGNKDDIHPSQLAENGNIRGARVFVD